MSGSEWKRREFVKVLMSLPLASMVGCAIEAGAPSEDALFRLVLALGPWTDRRRAEAFAARFLAAEQHVGLYLPEWNTAVRSLARRIPEGALAVGEIDLAALSDEEREFVVPFVQQLYSFIEVRFDVMREARWGECLGDRTRYTMAPT